MNAIINSIELLDANGTSYKTCIDNFKKGNQANISYHAEAPIQGIPKFDIPLSDEDLQTLTENEGFGEHYMPRSVKLAILAALRATKNIDLPKNTLVLGVTLQGPLDTSVKAWEGLFAKKKFISPRLGATITQNVICSTISRHLKLTGPSFMINQACGAFITALDVAEKFLSTGQVECAIVVGVDCATHPFTSFLFNSMSVHTHTDVRPFDKNRSGMALGEAATCYVLTSREKAQHKLAEIANISVYNDYYHQTSPNPDGSAGKFLLDNITENYTIKLDSIGCHATATKVGDEAELLSLENIPYTTDIYGLKGTVGHTMSSSAGVEMAYAIAGLNEGWVPYTSTSDDLVDSKHNVILHNIKEKEQTNFAKLSFGFGGVSAGVRIIK
jgi:3-oxoacyl-(acyl-carrier-protein) synthase